MTVDEIHKKGTLAMMISLGLAETLGKKDLRYLNNVQHVA